MNFSLTAFYCILITNAWRFWIFCTHIFDQFVRTCFFKISALPLTLYCNTFNGIFNEVFKLEQDFWTRFIIQVTTFSSLFTVFVALFKWFACTLIQLKHNFFFIHFQQGNFWVHSERSPSHCYLHFSPHFLWKN